MATNLYKYRYFGDWHQKKVDTHWHKPYFKGAEDDVEEDALPRDARTYREPDVPALMSLIKSKDPPGNQKR